MRDAERTFLARIAEHELASRVASALGLALLALGATLLGGVVFALVWAVAAVFFFAEFLAMIGYRPLGTGTALGAVGLTGAALGAERTSLLIGLAALLLVGAGLMAGAQQRGKGFLAAAGLAYAACVALPVILLRSQPVHGLALTLWLYGVVWATDIGAFFVGRALGGPKLWPKISPKKTWSGLVGGTVVGVGVAMLLNILLAVPGLASPTVLAVSLVASLAVHAGDLFESALKRKFSVSYSSQLIPGHGGFMDRLDGFALASLIVAVTLRVTG